MKRPPRSRFAFLDASLLVLAGLALAGSGCATGAVRASADTTMLDREGVYVRHVRVRLSPSHAQAFEALILDCVAAARAAELPSSYDWLCYREPPGRYWLLWSSETADGFAIPGGPDPVASFVRHILTTEKVGVRLTALDYEIEGNALHRQKAAWSTVEEMSTATHPRARMMVRTIKPGAAAAFGQALTARTEFLRDHGYPLPIEGFATLIGAPATALQVVFPRDWPSFHATDSFGAFVRRLDEAARDAYAKRKQALMITMDRAEYYDGGIAPELCYSHAPRAGG